MSDNDVVRTILIVDDASANIRALASLLKGEYRILVALGGEKALEIAPRKVSAGSYLAGYPNALHGRIRGLSALEIREPQQSDPGDFRHRQKRGGRRGTWV